MKQGNLWTGTNEIWWPSAQQFFLIVLENLILPIAYRAGLCNYDVMEKFNEESIMDEKLKKYEVV